MKHRAVAIHGMDWHSVLAELPPKATQAERDQAVADWAQRCWHDLCAALPTQSHAVVACAGYNTVQARTYMVAEQASGWLYSPLHGTPQAPIWTAESANVLVAVAQQAARSGFCGADALVLGTAAAYAAIEQKTATCPPDFGHQRRYFPLLGTPRATAFAAMPVHMLADANPYAVYPVMADADAATRCMDMGARLVQLRVKDASPERIASEIARSAQAAVQHNALLIVNDHWQAALQHAQHASGIYGVHLGQEDLLTLGETELDTLQASGLRLGLSSHSLWELARALRTRASHIACGPVHATTSKTMPWVPLGDTNVNLWANIVHGDAGHAYPPLPLVAIGGITPERAHHAAAAGADSVAVISAITQADDAAQALRDLQAAMASGHMERRRNPLAPSAWPQPTLPPSPRGAA